jgi:hypothetical protein
LKEPFWPGPVRSRQPAFCRDLFAEGSKSRTAKGERDVGDCRGSCAGAGWLSPGVACLAVVQGIGGEAREIDPASEYCEDPVLAVRGKEVQTELEAKRALDMRDKLPGPM